MTKPLLSTVTITHNNAATLSRTLSSLKFAAELIVVDSGSTDNTLAIARRAGARIFRHPWRGFGPQKNFGMRQARGEWVLFIDADEEVPPRLASEIQSAIRAPRASFYWLKIVTIFLGKPLPHLHGYNLRLFRRDSGYWDNRAVHERVRRRRDHTPVDLHAPDARHLRTPLLHHSHRTVRSYLRRMHHYTSLEVKEMLQTGRDRLGKPLPEFDARNIFSRACFLCDRAGRQLWRRFWRQQGWRDGWAGILWSGLSVWYEIVMARKFCAARLRERKKLP
jgi:glycosyltransferase involved in cell wall biosynthesis